MAGYNSVLETIWGDYKHIPCLKISGILSLQKPRGRRTCNSGFPVFQIDLAPKTSACNVVCKVVEPPEMNIVTARTQWISQSILTPPPDVLVRRSYPLGSPPKRTPGFRGYSSKLREGKTFRTPLVAKLFIRQGGHLWHPTANITVRFGSIFHRSGPEKA